MRLKEWVIARIPSRYQVPFRYWYRRAHHRLERELSIVCDLVPETGFAIDVGANNGAYTYALSRLGIRVEAFEPLPVCARNLEAFRSRNVKTHAVALSSEHGEREMFVPRAPGVTHTALASFSRPQGDCEVVRVPVRKLDEFAFKGVSFIKIDVEGHELDVLKGAAETIASSHPMLLIEIEQRHLPYPMEKVFQELSNRGYLGFFLFGGRMSPLKTFSYKQHQEPSLNNVMGKDYVNNFIFLHDQSPLRRRPDW